MVHYSLDITAAHISVHMEMDGVPSEPERLSGPGELYVLEPAVYLSSPHGSSVEHDLGSELVAVKSVS